MLTSELNQELARKIPEWDMHSGLLTQQEMCMRTCSPLWIK